METAAIKIARLNRSIARTGETVTIRRTSSDGTGAVTIVAEIVCPAHVRFSKPQDILSGKDDVTEAKLILSGSALAQTIGSPPVAFGVPNKDDIIVINSADPPHPTNVAEVKTIYYGGQLVRVNLLCRG
jgi:hypothetical protein